MKRILFFITFQIILIHSLNAQQWTWDTVLPTQRFLSLTKDHQQNVYTYHAAPAPNFTIYAPADTILTKYTADHKFIWRQHFTRNLKIRQVLCSPDSSIYLLAMFNNTL